MQLTTLELKGFKSFGDKVTIHFDRGITGIVGPNGCGKSNVVDAIRWVLGEQKSRMLRSDKMENIIFNGTRKRKATQLAEVSLTFDNTRNLLPTEYTQVTITRRYYRSGDSEYLLNGVQCRLKDIVTLFMDTGIATNSYSIIELKMVDDILNDKDNSRRQLFEEAAGVSKFRVRKKETLRKLESTDADLDRVEDLLFEIEKNLKLLERQAKQAEKYYQTKEAYQKVSIQLAKITVRTQHETLRRLQSQLEEEKEAKTSLSAQLGEQEALLEQRKEAVLQQEKLLASRQRTLNEHVEKIRTYESQKQVKNERLRALQERQQRLTEQLQQDRQTVEEATLSLDRLRTQQASVADRLEEVRERVATLEEAHQQYQARTLALKEEVAHAGRELRQKQDAVFQGQKQLEVKQMQLSSLRQELEKSAADTQAQSSSLGEFDQRAAALAEQREAQQAALQEAEQAEALLQQQVAQLTDQIAEEKEKLVQHHRRKDALQNEYNLTKSLVDSLEGFPEAIKFLKKAAWTPDAPLLSDIITCREEYRVCIENYLSPYMNYYVVESREDAWEAIRLLEDATKGKANFFILNQFSDFTPTPLVTIEQTVAAIAIAEYDNSYEKLAQFVLDNTYIVSEGACVPDQADRTFITQDGRVIQRPFSMSGGSVGLFEGKRIGRAKNLEKLEEQLQAQQQEIETYEARLQEQKQQLQSRQQSSQQNTIKQFQREINQLNQEYVTFVSKKEQLSETLRRSTHQREETQELMQELEEECQLLAPQVAEQEQALSDYEATVQDLNADLTEENEQLSEKSAAFNQEKILFFQQKNQLDSLEQEISYKQEAYDRSVQNIAQNEAALKEAGQAVQELLDSNEVGDDELLAFYEEKESIEAGVNEVEKAYYSARGTIGETEKAIREIQRQRENRDTLIMELQNQLNTTKLELSGVKERLSVEFEVDLDTLLAEGSEDEPSEAMEVLRERMETLRERIRKIGPINPMAMEAYDEIKQRYDFINSEKEDLVQAKESLLTTISEIDAVAKETFMEAFGQIKENFINVFRSLFTEEDKCDLRLSDPENPLSSSIDIIAQPKGKRPLTINQLSGGEKTLTATSLLFAIYLLKPAPFCIFDEVDAPLDDANIDKFNNIIRKFSEGSQFIIVTHNKRTMASTDVIYGVTMIEQGVSRVVPVDLRELEV